MGHLRQTLNELATRKNILNSTLRSSGGGFLFFQALSQKEIPPDSAVPVDGRVHATKSLAVRQAHGPEQSRRTECSFP